MQQYDVDVAAVQETSIPGSDLVIRQRPEMRLRFRILNKRKCIILKEFDSEPDWSFSKILISKDKKHLVVSYYGGHWLYNYDFIDLSHSKLQRFKSGNLIRNKCFGSHYDRRTRKPLLYCGAPGLLGTFNREWAVFCQGYRFPRSAKIDVNKFLLLSLKTHDIIMLNNFDTKRISGLEELIWKDYRRERWNYQISG